MELVFCKNGGFLTGLYSSTDDNTNIVRIMCSFMIFFLHMTLFTHSCESNCFELICIHQIAAVFG
jgi:hypothetical protein